MASGITIAKATAVAGFATAFFGILAYASPLFHSDPPPWINQTRVDDAVVKVIKMFNERSNATEASVVKGQILGAWSRLCDAERAKNLALAENYDAQLSDLQLDYMKLTGLTFPLRQCL